jgi:hypothetical protein
MKTISILSSNDKFLKKLFDENAATGSSIKIDGLEITLERKATLLGRPVDECVIELNVVFNLANAAMSLAEIEEIINPKDKTGHRASEFLNISIEDETD